MVKYMPFQIIKKDNYFILKNINTNKIINKKFKSKETAIKSGLNYMSYRNEKGKVKGNKIILLNNKKQ